ncbi:MAG: hypothetical protein ABW007_19215 [Chitinophagaceae bacterium]
MNMAGRPRKHPIKPKSDTYKRRCLTGDTYHWWTVEEKFIPRAVILPDGKHAKHKISYWCKCVCGIRRVLRADVLKNGSSTSCGCRYGHPVEGQKVARRKPLKNAEGSYFRSMEERLNGIVRHGHTIHERPSKEDYVKSPLPSLPDLNPKPIKPPKPVKVKLPKPPKEPKPKPVRPPREKKPRKPRVYLSRVVPPKPIATVAKPKPEAVPKETLTKVKLIAAMRLTYTKWSAIAEVTGLPEEECKRLLDLYLKK